MWRGRLRTNARDHDLALNGTWANAQHYVIVAHDSVVSRLERVRLLELILRLLGGLAVNETCHHLPFADSELRKSQE